MAAFPTTIVPSPNSNGIAGNTNGPYQAPSGAWYSCFPDLSNPTKINIYKSMDGGATWALMDGANSPTSQSSVAGSGIGVVVGNKIWTSTTDNVNIFMIPFDTSTDTWGVATNTGLAYPFNAGWVRLLAQPGLANPSVVLFTFSPVNVGLFTRNRCFYSIFDTLTLTATAYTSCGFAGNVNTDCDAQEAILGDASSSQFIFRIFDRVTGAISFAQQQLDSAGVLGSLNIFFVSGSPGLSFQFTGAGDGIRIAFSLVELLVDRVKVRVFTGASAPVVAFTEVDFSSTLPVGITDSRASVTFSNGVEFVFIACRTANDADTLFRVASDTGAGFGALATVGAWPGALVLESAPLPAAGAQGWGVLGIDATATEDATQFWASNGSVPPVGINTTIQKRQIIPLPWPLRCVPAKCRCPKSGSVVQTGKVIYLS